MDRKYLGFRASQTYIYSKFKSGRKTTNLILTQEESSAGVEGNIDYLRSGNIKFNDHLLRLRCQFVYVKLKKFERIRPSIWQSSIQGLRIDRMNKEQVNGTSNYEQMVARHILMDK